MNSGCPLALKHSLLFQALVSDKLFSEVVETSFIFFFLLCLIHNTIKKKRQQPPSLASASPFEISRKLCVQEEKRFVCL